MTHVDFVGDPARPVPDEQRSGSALHPVRVRRFGPRSLTSKLVTGVVSLVILLVVVVCGGTYFALKSFLSDKLDQQLQSTINQGAYRVFYANPSEGPRALEVWAVALDPSSGAVLTAPQGLEKVGLFSMDLSADQRASLITRANAGPITLRTVDGQELRVAAGNGVLDPGRPDAQPAVIVVGLSTHDERDTLHRLIVLEFLIGSGAVLAALIATTYGVQFSLRRLRRVTATAQEVAAELSPEGAGLDRRVENDEPETEVGQLATSFNTMLSAVETQFAARVESEQRMRQFLADASHELRTPLTSIRGYAELARMQRAIGDESDDNLGRIESEGMRMSRLVEDLLMLARGDADDDRTMRRELIEVDDLVDDVVSGSRAAFPERRIDMDVSGSPHVIGDRDQLVRVLRNLVTNAAVHTNADGSILVRAAGGATGVTIEVVDAGPGLPPEESAHVFERFWRADKARSRARGGSGLGLSIVAAIVRAHGGAVRFDSSVEGGSTVTVWLPAAHAAVD